MSSRGSHDGRVVFTANTPPSRPLSRSSSKLDLRSCLSRIISQTPTSAHSSEPDERTSLLDGDGSGRAARRSFTQELADARGPESEDNRKGKAVDGLIPREGGPGHRIRRKRSKTLDVARKIKQRSKYYVPVTEWLPKYGWQLFSGDLTAGLSLACLLIPQAMSYANGLAKLNPVAGLWSAAIPALIYGVLGTCRQLSLGPESALCLLIGQMIREKVYGDPHSIPEHPELESAAIALVTTFQVAIITLALGILRLGFLDVVLSRALLRGFITAVGIIIFIEQLVPMLGLEAILAYPDGRGSLPTSPLTKFFYILEHLEHTNRTTTILSFTSLAVLILARVTKGFAMTRPGGKWVRFIPEILLVVAGTTALTGIFRWDLKGVQVLGKVSAGGGNPFGLPLDKRQWKYFNYTFPTAFVSAIVGIVDSVVAARENGSKYGYAVSANRDLVALGASNIVASTFSASGCVPVFGSITRSRLNGLIGGRSQMSSIITSIVIILSIFFLLPSLFFLPKAVLAAIIALVVYAILAEAPHELMFFWRMKAWTDFLQMVGTFFLTLIFSIETGLVASVVFSLILVVQKSTQTRIKIIGRVPHTDDWVPLDEDDNAQEEFAGVLVVRVRESLSFANTGQLKERLRRLELYGMQKSHPSDIPRRESAKAVILHMGDVEDIDASAIQILYELTMTYRERGVGLHFVHLRASQVKLFQLVGISEMLGPSHFHQNLREAMKEIESLGYGNTAQSQF